MTDITNKVKETSLENSEFSTDDTKNLLVAMAQLGQQTKESGIEIRPHKKYSEVKDRVLIFRETFGTRYGIRSKLLPEFCEVGKIVTIQAEITDKDGNVIASGIASENIGIDADNKINVASGVENCDTSAIGRALSCLGLHGGEYASSNEMLVALTEKNKNLFQSQYPNGADSVKEVLKAMSEEELIEFTTDTKRKDFIKEFISHEDQVNIASLMNVRHKDIMDKRSKEEEAKLKEKKKSK
jgi:hypothetical protein